MNGQPAPADWFERAILIYGPRKAGTTLYQNLLDGTPGLLAYPVEMKLKRFATQPVTAAIDVHDYLALSRIPELDGRGLSRAGYLAAWEDVPAAALPLKELIRHDLEALGRAGLDISGAQCWSAKEVGGDTRRIIAKWREMFAGGKVLFIVREPLMVTRAVLNDRRRNNRRLPFWRIMRETYDPMRVVAAQASLALQPGTLIIAYEDLVANPEAVMRRVAEFLELPFSAGMVTPTLVGEHVVVATASRASKDIFRGEAAWDEGLTRRERLIVALTHRLFSLLPGFRVGYRRLRHGFRNSQAAGQDRLALPR